MGGAQVYPPGVGRKGFTVKVLGRSVVRSFVVTVPVVAFLACSSSTLTSAVGVDGRKNPVEGASRELCAIGNACGWSEPLCTNPCLDAFSDTALVEQWRACLIDGKRCEAKNAACAPLDGGGTNGATCPPAGAAVFDCEKTIPKSIARGKYKAACSSAARRCIGANEDCDDSAEPWVRDAVFEAFTPCFDKPCDAVEGCLLEATGKFRDDTRCFEWFTGADTAWPR
jgi:hypothetical protein